MMREFKIAYAGSRKAARWANTKTTWPDLCARLKRTQYTPESSEEYWAMSKDERDTAKDRGAFVGGSLKDGRRKITFTSSRNTCTPKLLSSMRLTVPVTRQEISVP